MARLAVVLYSYPARIARHRYLANLCYGRISAMPAVSVFVTTEQGGGLGEPSCFRHMGLDVARGYEFLPDKTLAMFRWFLSHTNCDYLLKCDDDLFVDPSAIRRCVTQQTQADYQGADVHTLDCTSKAFTYHQGKCSQQDLNQVELDVSWAPEGFTFAAGTCYLLSRKAVSAVIQEADASGFCPARARKSLDNRGVGAEDMLVAHLLLRQGIRAEPTLRVMYCDNWFKMLKQFRWELCGRLIRRESLKRCIGVCTSNRVPSWLERMQIRLWFLVSRLVPPV
jgi:hypothetical protein